MNADTQRERVVRNVTQGSAAPLHFASAQNCGFRGIKSDLQPIGQPAGNLTEIDRSDAFYPMQASFNGLRMINSLLLGVRRTSFQ